MTNWRDAARRPWRARLALLVGFALIGLIACALTGDFHPWWVPCAATAACAAIGVGFGEVKMRAAVAGRRGSGSTHERLTRQLWVAAAFVAAIVVALATSSILVGIITLIALLFASLAGPARF